MTLFCNQPVWSGKYGSYTLKNFCCVQVCILGLMLNMLNMASARYLTLKCIWHRFARCTFEIFETRDLVKNSHTFQSRSSLYSIWLPIKVDCLYCTANIQYWAAILMSSNKFSIKCLLLNCLYFSPYIFSIKYFKSQHIIFPVWTAGP